MIVDLQRKIPTEIIEHISEYLLPIDKQKCLLVCHQWYVSFRYSLYKSIQIENMSLFESLEQSVYGNSFNGYWVQQLRIHVQNRPYLTKAVQEQTIHVAYDILEWLPVLCPNIKIISLDPETWRLLKIHPNIARWNFIEQLPPFIDFKQCINCLEYLGPKLMQLVIESKILVGPNTSLEQLLSHTPNLKEFTIYSSELSTLEEQIAGGSFLRLSVNDMELVHLLLPRLESFKLLGNGIQLIDTDMMGSSFTNTTLSNYSQILQIKRIHWEVPVPIIWLRYISQKYPHVQFLTLSACSSLPHFLTQSSQDTSTRSYDSLKEYEKSLFIHIAKQCKHLELISISYPVSTRWFNESFFKAIQRRQCLVHPLSHPNNRIKSDEELQLALTYPRLFEALDIEQWRLNTKLPFTLTNLHKFDQLKHLRVQCDSYHAECDLDTILNSCAALKSLELEWGELKVKKNAGYQRHGLESLRITFSAFDKGVFNYVSNRCRQLKELKMTKSKQLMNKCDSEMIFHLDMPWSHLSMLILDSVRLDIDAVYQRQSGYIQLAQINGKWIRHVGYDDKKVPAYEELNKDDYHLARNYLEQKCEINKNDLEASFMFGYANINCRSLEHFVLDGHVSC